MFDGLPAPSTPASTPAPRAVGLACCLHVLLAAGLLWAPLTPSTPRSLGGEAMLVSLQGLPSAAQGGGGAAPETPLHAAAPTDSPPQKEPQAEQAPPLDALPVQAAHVPQNHPKPQPAAHTTRQREHPAHTPPRVKAKRAAHADTPPTPTAHAQGNPGNPGPATHGGDGGAGQAAHNAASEGTEGGMALVQFNSGNGPRFLRQSHPRYPEMARRMGKQGTAIVEARLDAHGRLVDSQILRADREDFGQAALASIRASTYVPAQHAGRNVGCVVRIPVCFVLRP